MTTRLLTGVHVTTTPNLFCENDSLLLPQNSPPNEEVLAAYTLEKKVGPEERRKVWGPVIQQILETLAPHLGEPELWLCACTCGPNSSITHYRKVWKALAAGGYDAPVERRTDEIHRSSTAGDVFYYGAAPLSAEDILVAPVGPSSRAFLAIFFDWKTPNIAELSTRNWFHGLHDLKEVKSLATEITRQGGILVRLFGEYDEREAGLDLIMGESMFIELEKPGISGYLKSLWEEK